MRYVFAVTPSGKAPDTKVSLPVGCSLREYAERVAASCEPLPSDCVLNVRITASIQHARIRRLNIIDAHTLFTRCRLGWLAHSGLRDSIYRRP